tara:strand:+ start:3731 stop:4354 length:624 start_codon:yes stop_codon:yes gene_type:complete
MEFSAPLIYPILIIGGYLIGSLPTGYLAGVFIADVDLRQLGSGSTGATNVLRHLGRWAALIVFIIDVLKGALPILIAKSLNIEANWQVLAGLMAIIGHIWPIWLKGKGGKAVATGLGLFLGLSWHVGLAALGIFLVIFSLTKTVSIASILSSITLPFLMLLSFQGSDFRPAYLFISIGTMGMVLWRHRSNLKRIKEGREPKIGSKQK